MKKLFVTCMVCSLTGTSNAQIALNHFKGIEAKRINSTTIWFVHTYDQEIAKDRGLTGLYAYSNKRNDSVDIVSTNPSTPTNIADLAYRTGVPQPYNYGKNYQKLLLDDKTLGLTGTLYQDCSVVTYSKNAGVIEEITDTQKRMTSISMGFLALTLILAICLAPYKNDDYFGLSYRQKNRSAAVKIIVPIGIGLVIFFDHVSPLFYLPEIHNILNLYVTSPKILQIPRTPLILMAIYGIMELIASIINSHIPSKKKLKMGTIRTIVNFIEDKRAVRFNIALTGFVLAIIYSFSHNWYITRGWLITAICARLAVKSTQLFKPRTKLKKAI